MNKTTTFSLMTIALISTVAASAFVVKTADAKTQRDADRRAPYVNALSPELTVPAVLPARIDDPVLMEAWIRLYNRQNPIQLWDGSTLTGQMLAQFVLDNNIAMVWDTEGACGSGSCSLKKCADCGYASDSPIYMMVAEQTFGLGMEALVSTLAHEAFHRTEPFGVVSDTRFEEFWAFYIGAKITPEVGLHFDGYNSLDPDNLNLWITDSRIDAYLQLPAYPDSVQTLISVASTSSNFEGIPTHAYAATN